MFRIKICGITRAADARLAAEAGADAIGLNFYAGSPRCVTQHLALAICEALPAGVAKVGVFVNMPTERICELADALDLDWIQLHGDESPAAVAALTPRRVLKALRISGATAKANADYLARCQSIGAMPAAVLADAAASGAYGGTGQRADWGQLAPPHDWLLGAPLVLAGGLEPENVAEAIRRVRPAAVDTASGVESSPGCKDPQRIRQFIAAARQELGL